MTMERRDGLTSTMTMLGSDNHDYVNGINENRNCQIKSRQED